MVLPFLAGCSWDWDRFTSVDDGAPASCSWDDPARFTLEAPALVPELSSPARELDPFLAPDRLSLYFASERGDGKLRSYRAIRSERAGPFDRVEEQSEINVPGCISRFALSANGLTAFISARGDFPGSCGGRFNIYWARRGSTADPFTTSQFSPTGLNTSQHELDPFPSNDGLRLYYVEDAPTESTTRMLLAERVGSGAVPEWKRQGPVPGLELASCDADNPALSVDELLIVFSANLSGSVAGSRDLWYAVRSARNEPFGAPRPLPGVQHRAGRDRGLRHAGRLRALLRPRDGGAGRGDLQHALPGALTTIRAS
jgi:hypothetical protein